MNLDDITRDTLEAVKKAQTSGWTSGTGVTGIDLSGVVSLIPSFVPLREQLARVGSTTGAKFTQWKALLNVVDSQPSIFTGFDTAGALVIVDEQDVFSNYQPIALAGQVTQDAVDFAKGYADAHALEVMNVLTQLMILEDRALGTGAQAYALPAIAQPTLTAATTGGTIGATVTVHVRVAARSGMNYFNGGSGVACADTTVVTSAGTTNSVTASVVAVKGAVAYDWYVGGFYYTTTTMNGSATNPAVTITSVPTANQALPTNELPDLFGTAPTAVPTADSSFSANAFNSMLATILGDYGAAGLVTPGTGTSSGATWTSMDGAKLTISGSSVTQLDALNMGIWNAVKLSPTAYMCAAQQANDLSQLLLGTYLAPTYLQPDAAGRSNIAGGGYIGSYLNKAAGGKVVRIEVHPSVPPGTIIARTDSVPFQNSNIGNVFEVRTLRDYAEFPYAATRTPASGPSGPREEFEVRSLETLVNRAPVACGVVSNIQASS